MDKKLLLKMLPGFIPLVVFILADEIWGTEIGLIVAVVCGVVPLAYGWIKDRVIDRFILFETLLIVILGVVSIVLDNEAFFKLKPALIGVLLTILLGVSAFTPANLVLGMSKRYMGKMNLNQDQINQFKKTLRLMFFVFAVHTLMIFYSVWFMSKEAWAFISGGLFYILFGVVFLVEFIQHKAKQRALLKEEYFPVLNDKGEVIGKAPKSICLGNKRYLCPVIHLHIFNNKKQLYLQENTEGRWNTALVNHLVSEETIEAKIKREMYERFAIERFDVKLVEPYLFESDTEREYVFLGICRYDASINTNEIKLDVDDGKFWSISEIKENLKKDVFTLNFESEFTNLFKLGLLK